jgi:predicted Zn-dependent protease
LSHELSHIALNHSYSSKCRGNDYNSRVCEAEADWNAIKIMTDSGYDCTEASKYYAAQIARWGDYDDSAATHPALTKRATNAETTCKIYKETGKLPEFVKPKEPTSGK